MTMRDMATAVMPNDMCAGKSPNEIKLSGTLNKGCARGGSYHKVPGSFHRGVRSFAAYDVRAALQIPT
jgi:hypothetical protein